MPDGGGRHYGNGRTEEFIKILGQRNFPVSDVQLNSSDGSAGKKLFVKHQEIIVKENIHKSFAGTDECYVGRLRKDSAFKNGLAMWVVADNIRKGAALNAVQILEEIIKRGWLAPGG